MLGKKAKAAAKSPSRTTRKRQIDEASSGAAKHIDLDGTSYVILQEAAYQNLVQNAEMADDIAHYDFAKDALRKGETELVPFDLLTRVVAGENPIRVWRQYRRLTQADLAARAGVDRSHISKLEAGRAAGNVATLRKLAEVLDLTIDDLVAAPREDEQEEIESQAATPRTRRDVRQ